MPAKPNRQVPKAGSNPPPDEPDVHSPNGAAQEIEVDMQDITDISANESDSETYTSKAQEKSKRKAEKMLKSQCLLYSSVLQKRYGLNEKEKQKKA